jgi:hypothetical protein
MVSLIDHVISGAHPCSFMYCLCIKQVVLIIMLCLAASCASRSPFLLVTLFKVYFPATVAMKFSLLIFALKSPKKIKGYHYCGPFHIRDSVDHKTHPLLHQGYPQLVHMLI